MHFIYLSAGAATAALAFAYAAIGRSSAARRDDVRENRRAAALAVAAAGAALLLGWAASAVDLGPLGVSVLAALALLSAVGLAYALRTGALD